MKNKLQQIIWAFAVVFIGGLVIKLVSLYGLPQQTVNAGPAVVSGWNQGKLWGIIGLVAAAVGVCTAMLGWYFLRHANRLAQHRMERLLAQRSYDANQPTTSAPATPRQLAAGHRQRLERKQLNTVTNASPDTIGGWPHSLGGFITLGNSSYERGHVARAIELFQEAIMHYPDHKEPYRYLAALYIHEEEMFLAIDCLEQALMVDPSIRRDVLEDPLFDALANDPNTRDRYERMLTVR